MRQLKCSCGAIIPDSAIICENKCNEEGEDYSEVSATCEKCSEEWETSSWGHWEDFDEAKSYLQGYIEELS